MYAVDFFGIAKGFGSGFKKIITFYIVLFVVKLKNKKADGIRMINSTGNNFQSIQLKEF